MTKRQKERESVCDCVYLGKFPLPGTTYWTPGGQGSQSSEKSIFWSKTFPRERGSHSCSTVERSHGEAGYECRGEDRIRKAFLERYEVEPEKGKQQKPQSIQTYCCVLLDHLQWEGKKKAMPQEETRIR